MASLPPDILAANGIPAGLNVPAGITAPPVLPPPMPLNAEIGPTVGRALAADLTEGEKTAAAGGGLGLLWLVGLYFLWKDWPKIRRLL